MKYGLQDVTAGLQSGGNILVSRGHEKQNTIKKARYKAAVNLNRRPYLFKSTLVIEYADKRPAKFSSRNTKQPLHTSTVYQLANMLEIQYNPARKAKLSINLHFLAKYPNPPDRPDAAHYTRSNSGKHAESPQEQTAHPQLQGYHPDARGSACRGLVRTVIISMYSFHRGLTQKKKKQKPRASNLPALACQAMWQCISQAPGLSGLKAMAM